MGSRHPVAIIATISLLRWMIIVILKPPKQRHIPIGIRTIAPEENCSPAKVRVWVRVSFRVGGQFSLGPIVLEPF